MLLLLLSCKQRVSCTVQSNFLLSSMGKRKDDSPAASSSHKKQRQEVENSYDEADIGQTVPGVSSGLGQSKRQKKANNKSHNEMDYESFVDSSQNGSSSQSSTGDVGIIESISLKNFMCHSMLGPFHFGPNVNFIIGNNGSGKSAVLTALIVGLGGKAAITNRGSSIKGFVKDGQSSADISVTLRNRGQDAYKPEVYGKSITVFQRLTADGSRTYRIKSATG
ncbi:hypothetical protein GDO86_000188, partial [Hymenochirus boettgeri]